MFKIILLVIVLFLIFGFGKKIKRRSTVNINTILLAALVVLFLISIVSRFQH